MGAGLNAWLFGREAELALLRSRIQGRQPFLLHGPAGVGKSLLLRAVISRKSEVLYCANSASPQQISFSLTQALLENRDRTAETMIGRKDIAKVSAVSLKGIVLESLRGRAYIVVLDQLHRPSQAIAAMVRELSGAGAVVIAAARSAHMEDAGFVLPLYTSKEQKLELRNFDSKTATLFTAQVANRLGIMAENRQELLDKVQEYSAGNPGAIEAMLRRAREPRYQSGNHIKIAPLYIDFRLEWNASA